ncbi:MAG TPA: alpha/beta fold hydrolase [Thermoanaerobaculia bacterium]|nr:alpha/beta fold hydrolase [Thermoanaerobaculia bacterium]
MDRIPIVENGREVSFLAVRYDAPEDGGTALPCFLYLHGFGSDQSGEKAEFFRSQALAAGFAFCSFDFQGHGESGGALGDVTLTRSLRDIARVHGFLRDKGHRRLLLLGSSMGGGCALWYSALHPEEIVAGLHIAPALEMDRGLLTWAGPERARLWEETGTIHFKNDFVACDLRWSLIEDMSSYPLETLYARYRTPCLLLQGKRDDSVPWKNVVDFATRATFPEIDLHLFADGDHRLNDRKERLWELMMEFLRGRRLI